MDLVLKFREFKSWLSYGDVNCCFCVEVFIASIPFLAIIKLLRCFTILVIALLLAGGFLFCYVNYGYATVCYVVFS